MKQIIIFAIFGITLFLIGGYLHEQVHVAIFNQYNISSQVYYLKYFPDIVTISDKPCPDSNCILANSINEAVSYNIMLIFTLLLIGLVFILCMLDYQNFLKEKELKI